VKRALLFALLVSAVFADGPDPNEIPLPPIKTAISPLPGVGELPVRKEMPDVLTMNDGTKVTNLEQWKQRRQEIRRVLEYYAVGAMPPSPGNVKGREIKSQTVLDGTVKYRLVHLTFGPKEKLSLDIGIFTPAEGGPFPAVIMPAGTPPGATPLPRQAQGPGQGRGTNALLSVGGGTPSTNAPPRADAETVAARLREVFRRGYAHVMFNNNDCGEDTTLRNADGSWAYRNARFYPAYPNFDWGLLGGWAWGVSRIVDYLETDPAIDKSKLIVSGVSRTGKSAMITGAFDERIAMAAPIVTGGGGIGAYRFSGAWRGGKEGLGDMMRKYPNWFSPHLRQFWGQVDRLPFDQHWFLALMAPRPFIALEGIDDQVSLANAVKQSWLGALPAYALFGATDKLGVNYAKHGHAFTQEDWNAMLDFADKNLRGMKVQRRFDQFPSSAALNVRDFGAVGDGKTKDTAALQRALDACAAAGGGEVVVPAGEYLTGSLDLKSRTTLRLETNATLAGSADLADYPIIDARWEGRWVKAHRALISTTKAQHIAVIGPGRIAGSQALGGRQMPRRPCVIEPIDCTDVRLEGFTASQRLMWTIHPTYCENLTVSNVTIRSIGGNSDGVDVDSCKHVVIEGCEIESGDDCIALKSGRGMEGYRLARPTEDVLIRDCTLADNNFACIGIGSETSGGIRDVRVERCKFTLANTYAIYIKSRPGRGAFIKDIAANDLEVRTAPKGFLRINLLNSGIQDPEPVPGDEGFPRAKNLRFSNVRVDCGTLVDAASIPMERPVDGLVLENISGTCTKGIALANITNAVLHDIRVTGYDGDFLSITNVQGTGLEGAVALEKGK
jgi:(4-O-methyl)-D-glucuronate---lignin esterase